MFALVESGKITQFPRGNKGITIGDNQYPQSIYTVWIVTGKHIYSYDNVRLRLLPTSINFEPLYLNTKWSPLLAVAVSVGAVSPTNS